MPDRIFRTPYEQRLYNNHGNNEFDQIFRLGIPKISEYLNMDNDTLIECLTAVMPIACHFKIPSCKDLKNFMSLEVQIRSRKNLSIANYLIEMLVTPQNAGTMILKVLRVIYKNRTRH